MKWSAVITTYNSCSVVERAVESILSLDSEEAPSDIVVVDNNSEDNTVDILSAYANNITLRVNRENLGLSRANNIGAELAQGESLFFLNPDVEILPGAVSELYDFQMDHPAAAIIGPGMIDASGRLQSTARTWPTPWIVASRRTRFGNTAAGKKLSDDHLNRFFSREMPVRPHWLVGAALWLTPQGKERVGFMSENYFLYFEDVEWCARAWKRNMEVWYVPSAVIRHVCRRESSSGGEALKHHMKSMLRFFFTHPGLSAGLKSRGEHVEEG